MKKTINYATKGTCAREIRVTIDGEIIEKVEFVGGCNGNTKGIASLVEGQNIDDTIKRIRGIKCGMKSTSCPDQLSLALEKAKAELAKENV